MKSYVKGTRPLVFLLSFLGLAGAGLVGAGTASAVNPITNCGQPIDSSLSGSYELTTDLNYTGSAACLEVRNGKTLNLNGYTITCQAGYTCGQAVLCPTSDGVNSLIQSTVSADGGDVDINGGFTAAVKNCGTVKNLKIVGAATGILFDAAGLNGQAFTGNVIEPSVAGTGIDVKMEDGGDQVSDNLIRGGNVGIFLRYGKSTTLGAQVKENIIRSYGIAGIQSTITSNDYFRIDKNTIIEGDDGSVPFDIAGTHPTYSANICEDEGPVDNNRCACEMDRMDATTAGGCPL